MADESLAERSLQRQRALSRWENEGGAVGRQPQEASTLDEELLDAPLPRRGELPLQVVGAASGDPEQAIVARRGEVSSVRHGLGIEVEQWWHARRLVIQHVVGALAQQIHGRERPPPCVGPIPGP